MTRLEKIYREKVVPVLQKEFSYSSSMQLPGIEKISLNIGLGAASSNNKLMEEAMAIIELSRALEAAPATEAAAEEAPAKPKRTRKPKAEETAEA